MSSTMPAQAANVKHKALSFSTSVRWLSGRAGVLASRDKVSVRVSSPPEFKGETGVWTPEDFLVGAVDACLMATFVAFSEKAGLAFRSYSSDAEGVLEFVDGGYRLTRVIVRPRIQVATKAESDRARRVLGDAHERCIVSNSILAEVRVEPEIEVGP
jgi:peroxiredoxin-like protein